MTLDPDCASVGIDNSAASANRHPKLTPPVRSVLNSEVWLGALNKSDGVMNARHLFLTAISRYSHWLPALKGQVSVLNFFLKSCVLVNSTEKCLHVCQYGET